MPKSCLISGFQNFLIDCSIQRSIFPSTNETQVSSSKRPRINSTDKTPPTRPQSIIDITADDSEPEFLSDRKTPQSQSVEEIDQMQTSSSSSSPTTVLPSDTLSLSNYKSVHFNLFLIFLCFVLHFLLCLFVCLFSCPSDTPASGSSHVTPVANTASTLDEFAILNLLLSFILYLISFCIFLTTSSCLS